MDLVEKSLLAIKYRKGNTKTDNYMALLRSMTKMEMNIMENEFDEEEEAANKADPGRKVFLAKIQQNNEAILEQMERLNKTA